MRNYIAMAALALLAGCGANPGSPAPDYASIVGMIQTNYTTVRATAVAYTALPNANPASVKTITSTIAAADAIIPALTATTAPTTIQAAAQDLATLVATPAGAGINPTTKADISFGLSVLLAAAQVASTLGPLL